MTNALLARVGHTDGTVLEVCQCLPGAFLATGDHAAARDVLLALAHAAGPGLLGPDAGKKSRTPDLLGNLWFLQAAYLYAITSGDTTTWRTTLLPLAKRFAHAVISGAVKGVRMTDSGMLAPTSAKAAHALDIVIANILWDNALTILAGELRAAGDSAGDHFERLSGRFSRSFIKGAWCDAHVRLCDPDARAAENHPATTVSVGVEQLLLGALPFSMITRTKQRLILDRFLIHSRADMGVCIGPLESPEGRLASPLYLAWLVEGHVRTSDTPATAIAEGVAWLAHAHQTLTDTGRLARYYLDAAPAKLKGNPAAHGPTMAEVQRIWLGLHAAAGRSPGNSKRARLSGLLLPERA